MSGAEDKRLQPFRPARDLPPFLVAALILAFVVRGKDWDAVATALSGVNLPLFLLGAGGFALGYYLVSASSYVIVYNFFGARLRLREILVGFGACLLPQALFPALGQILFLIYMVKKQKVPLWQAVGNNAFIIYCDLWVMATVIGAALVLLPHPPAVFVWAFSIFVPVLLMAGWWARLGGGKHLFPRLHQATLFNALRTGSARQYLGFYAFRLAWQAAQVAFHSLALLAIGIAAPVGMVGVLVMLMSLTSLAPVSALGFGGPNLVAEYFAPWVGAGHSPAETAFAYGLLFQTVFLAVRLLIGTALALPAWRSVTRD